MQRGEHNLNYQLSRKVRLELLIKKTMTVELLSTVNQTNYFAVAY